jgi:hypothetical protein
MDWFGVEQGCVLESILATMLALADYRFWPDGAGFSGFAAATARAESKTSMNSTTLPPSKRQSAVFPLCPFRQPQLPNTPSLATAKARAET